MIIYRAIYSSITFRFSTGSVDSCYGPVRNPWRYDFSRQRQVHDRTVPVKDRKSYMDRQRHFHHSAVDLIQHQQHVETLQPQDDYDDWYVCGGSSGGSAVAVATGICFA